MADSVTIAIAGAYLGAEASLSQIVTLFTIAFVIGLISVLFYSFVPSG